MSHDVLGSWYLLGVKNTSSHTYKTGSCYLLEVLNLVPRAFSQAKEKVLESRLRGSFKIFDGHLRLLYIGVPRGIEVTVININCCG